MNFVLILYLSLYVLGRLLSMVAFIMHKRMAQRAKGGRHTHHIEFVETREISCAD